jgi:hypothetical protein
MIVASAPVRCAIVAKMGRSPEREGRADLLLNVAQPMTLLLLKVSDDVGKMAL